MTPFGCCSTTPTPIPAPPTKPTLPPGRPTSSPRSLADQLESWDLPEGWEGAATLPARDLLELVRVGLAWEAYAEALEASVDWSE